MVMHFMTDDVKSQYVKIHKIVSGLGWLKQWGSSSWLKRKALVL